MTGRLLFSGGLLGLALACTGTRAPVSVEVTPIAGGYVSAPLEIEGPVEAAVIPLNAYVRIQARPSVLTQVIPYVGWFDANRASDDVTTLDYGDAFRATSERFLSELLPGARLDPGRSDDLRIELKLVRTTYHRDDEEFRQFVTLRLLAGDRTVIYQTVAETTVSGDVLETPALVNRALEQSFRELGRKVSSARDQILEDVEFHRSDYEIVRNLLLARAAALGRSPRQNRPDAAQLAVVIGVSDYQADHLDLGVASKDARDLFAILNDPRNRLNYANSRVVLLLDRDATLRNIRTALSRWLQREAGPNDSVLIYFAGHGIYDLDLSAGEDKKEKYFLPNDFDPTDSTFASGIPMDEITEYFGKIEARETVMIFDACHAGAASLDDRTDELRRFTAERSSQRTKAILAAAKAHQVSIEVDTNGLFTLSLLEALRGRGDADADGEVTLTEASRYVSRVVADVSERDYGILQEPVLKVNDRRRASDLPLVEFP